MKTEERNDNSRNLHKKSIAGILQIINQEDQKVAGAVRRALPEIERAVEKYVDSCRCGGTVYYIGAGTSGRLGVLDASEMPPTFGVPEDRTEGVIAGGKEALMSAKEGSEDNREEGKKLIEKREISKNDFVVGITASGTTPFVLGCLEETQKRSIPNAGITNNSGAQVENFTDITMVVETGPEVITGSTRMKAGTAQKMVLNMLSTAAMIKLGKVYDNVMVDMVASNSKLRRRAKRILSTLTSVDEKEIEEVLAETDYHVKPALLALKANIEVEKAIGILKQNDGYLDRALDWAKGEKP